MGYVTGGAALAAALFSYLGSAVSTRYGRGVTMQLGTLGFVLLGGVYLIALATAGGKLEVLRAMPDGAILASILYVGFALGQQD